MGGVLDLLLRRVDGQYSSRSFLPEFDLGVAERSVSLQTANVLAEVFWEG